MPPSIFRAIALLLPLLLVSCFGGAVMHGNQRVMARFNIEKSVRVIHGGNRGPNPTGKDIKAIWGEPDRTATQASDTVWTYDTKPGVAGVMPIFYLPLPLLIPTKSDGIDFYFRMMVDRLIPLSGRDRFSTGDFFSGQCAFQVSGVWPMTAFTASGSNKTTSAGGSYVMHWCCQ